MGVKGTPGADSIRFTKMHGIGNDYIYINCFEESVDDPSALAVRLSKRHFGVGSDGLVLIMRSRNADFRMRMFNPDGTEAEMCGNAIRCVGKFVRDRGLTGKNEVLVETLAGIRILKLFLSNDSGTVGKVKVDMGGPEFEPQNIPILHEGTDFINLPVEIDGTVYRLTCVSMGNPHAVIYVDDVETLQLGEIGPKVERHPMFPQRTNVEFVQVVNKGILKMRVWERGTGETLACGTGACAAAAASYLNGLSGREAVVKLRGGDLNICWDESDGHIYMTGPAEFVFDGVVYPGDGISYILR